MTLPKSRRPRVVAATAITAMAALLIASPIAAHAGSAGQKPAKKIANATFGAAPANSKGPTGAQHFVIDTTAGGFTDTDIAVLNLTHKPERLQVYPVDAVPATNGVISFPARSAKRTGVGAWMSIGTPHGQGYVDVKPRSTDILPVHIRIPKNAPPGDHVGAVVVSLLGKVQSKFGSSGAQKVKFEQRLAVQAQFRIAGPLHPNLSVQGLSASYHGPIDPFTSGSVRIHFAVHNGGNVVLGGPQTITVNGLFGQSEVSTPVSVPGLLPGATYPVTLTVPHVYPEAFMSAKVSVNVQGLQGQITPGLHPIESSTSFFAVQWIDLAALVLLLLFIGRAIRRRWKKRQDKKGGGRGPGKGTGGTPTKGPDASLENVSSDNGSAPSHGKHRAEPVEQGAAT